MVPIIIYCLLLALNIWIFFIRPKKPLTERVSLLFEIIGVYTLLYGFLAQTEMLANFADIANDMTSPDIKRFISGNFRAMSFFFSAGAVGSDVFKANMSPTFLLEPILYPMMTIISAILSFFYIIIILPISYLAYVCASVPVNAILSAGQDVLLRYGEAEINVKEVVAANIITVKNLIVAIPALVLSLVLKIIQVNEGTLSNIKVKIKMWLAAHPRVTQVIQQMLKIGIILFSIIMAFMTSIHYSILSPIDMTKSGELAGVIIIGVLVILILFWVYGKARKFQAHIYE